MQSKQKTLLIIMDYFTVLLTCLFLLPYLLYALLFSRRRNDVAWKLPPGPIKLPLIGNLHQFGILPHRSLHKLSRKHGVPLMYLKLGSVPTVVASSAETAKALLKTHDLECCNRPFSTSFEKLSYGCCDIAFAPYGEQWRELRKICMVHFFSTKKVASFRSIREDEVNRMVNYISLRCNSEINLSEEMVLLANNITCRSAAGKRYYGDGTDSKRLYEILLETQAMFVGFFFADFIPIFRWLDALTGMRGRLQKNFEDLDEFYQKVIDSHLHPTREDERDKDVVDTLLDMQKTTSQITDYHIKGVLMNLFIGGSETSSIAIEWAMAELMRRPKAMKKVQDEARGLIGIKKGKVDESDLDQLLYLTSVVKETMRLHPPVPLLVQRETMSHCKINNHDIPAKTRLLINAWAIGRDPDVWGNPDKFYPERFINSPIDLTGHDFQLIPFGAGRRICPGMHSGILVTKLALANLLYHFDWELPKGMSKEDIDMDEAPGLTVHKRSALRLVAKKYSLERI